MTQYEELTQTEFATQNEVIKIQHCNANCMNKYIGQHVAIIGISLKVSSTPFSTTFMSSDGNMFTVIFNSKDTKIQFDKRYNQIRGIVKKDGILEYKSHKPVGDSFCFWTWNKIIILMNKYPELFE